MKEAGAIGLYFSARKGWGKNYNTGIRDVFSRFFGTLTSLT